MAGDKMNCNCRIAKFATDESEIPQERLCATGLSLLCNAIISAVEGRQLLKNLNQLRLSYNCHICCSHRHVASETS